MILGIIAGIAVIGTVGAMIVGMSDNNFLTMIGSGIIGGIVTLIVGFVISGYELDIIKYGIERDNGSPNLDFVR